MTAVPAQDFETRRALVTGGAVRVGAVISRALVACGYRVAVHYHSSAGAAEALVRELDPGQRGLAEAFRADLGEAHAVSTLFAEVGRRLGGLDLLVNSAAIFPYGDPLEVSPSEWDRVYVLNVRAPFLCAQAAARLMGQQGGSIVNIADVAAFEAWPGYVPYAASKAALVSMTRGLALAWAPRIRVNAVAPGAVLLPEAMDSAKEREAAARRSALGRIGTPADVAQAVLYLDRASYVTGEVVRVDGGQHLK